MPESLFNKIAGLILPIIPLNNSIFDSKKRGLDIYRMFLRGLRDIFLNRDLNEISQIHLMVTGLECLGRLSVSKGDIYNSEP